MAMKKALDQDNPKFDMFNAENRNEWVRVQSFSTFPTSSIDISLLSLAHAGFYYTGIDAECRCFSCGKVYKKWKDRDNPYNMHRKISPNCLYMNGRESGNVPVDETDRDRPRPFTYATLLTTVSDAGQEETVGVPDSARSEVVKLGNIELEEKTESKGDKRESQDDRRRMRRQYDEEAERLAGQNGDDNSSHVQRNADTSGMVDNQIDHQNSTTCTTDNCTLLNNVRMATDSNNCLHSYPNALTDEHHSKVPYSTSILQSQRLRYLDLLNQIRKFFETIDYKGLKTVYKNLFCNDNLYQSLYVYPVVEAQGELNDTTSAIPNHHPGDHTYLSASGNPVCHPDEEQESNIHTIHTEVQLNNALAEARQVNVSVSDNRVLNVDVSDNGIESRGGEEDEMSLPSNCIPARQPLGILPDLEVVEPRPITGIHGRWHRNSFEDLPVLLANQHGTTEYQDTCPLDPGLMILGYQMKINPYILNIFTGSSHSIFNTELLYIFNLFKDRKYEDLRGKWAEIIGWISHSFRGCDGEVMMPPFSDLIQFKYLYECSNVTCPLNRREFSMPAMRLRCPEQRFLDSCKLRELINVFTRETINPCWEPIHHPRPDTTGMFQLNSSFYSNSRCSGTCTIHRIVQTSPEQPPMVILNMTRSRLTRDQIGNLSGTVKIGDVHYYIGGITFAGNEHYTGIIILHQQNRLLFYDNLHGIKVIDNIHQGPASDVLSLIYLFRER